MRKLIPLLLLSSLFLAQPGRTDELHAIYTDLLQEHVDAEGLVDYQAILDSPQTLNAYLDRLSGISSEEYEAWNEHQQLAFLLNLYNAATLKLIVAHYPLESIKDIGGWFNGPWDQEVVPYLGKIITLHHLEHDIIRKDFLDTPETHFALVCAAIGCPPLRREAYTAEKLEAQLQDQKKRFLANTERNRKNAKRESLRLSPIFKWYAEDFEKSHGSVQEYLATAWPEVEKDWRIRYTFYDWSLNTQ